MKTPNFDFFKHRKVFIGISIAVVLVGIILSIVIGAKLDIQFAGGAIIKYSVDGEINPDEIERIVKDTTGRDTSVNSSTLVGTQEKHVTLSFAGNEGLSLEEQEKIATVLSESYSDKTFKVVESSSVDPTMGSKFFQKCLVCLILTAIILLAYISFRFRRINGTSAGVTAIIALLHDTFIIYFVFVIFRININDIFIAVILTILGYSLNDTIVIYDRIRENNKLMGAKADPIVVMNNSLNQTLGRTVFTSVATFLAVFVVFIVSEIFGITSVRTFALPMMIGIVCGCYSSLFLSTPLYTIWQIYKKKRKTTLSKAK